MGRAGVVGLRLRIRQLSGRGISQSELKLYEELRAAQDFLCIRIFLLHRQLHSIVFYKSG
jgi:hypothetical protein